MFINSINIEAGKGGDYSYDFYINCENKVSLYVQQDWSG